MQLIDTHCHIHESGYPAEISEVLKRASEAEVTRLICVGTDETTSQEAVEFTRERDNCWASIGLHPHDAISGVKSMEKLQILVEKPKVIAVGECGLDYFYEHSPKPQQIQMLCAQIELAQKHNLPMIFHVRDAFDDFWPIFDEYKGIHGVLHSFTDTSENLQKAIDRGLYIGVNGIATFTKVEAQKQMYGSIPLERLLLETDSPFLTPVPMRGSVNEPAFVKLVAKYMADLRHLTLEELSAATSQNANTLFKI